MGKREAFDAPSNTFSKTHVLQKQIKKDAEATNTSSFVLDVLAISSDALVTTSIY